MVSITHLHIYPVKSLRGIRLEKANLTPRGFEHDRQFMIIDRRNTFVTQREHAPLALVDTALVESGIVLSRPGHGSVLLPFEAGADEGDPVSTKVWMDEVETRECGTEAAEWITAAVDSKDPLRIVRLAPGFRRPMLFADVLGDETSTVFADASPFTLVSEASLQKLNDELAARGHTPVPMNRFRPNIVVDGLGPFEEHELEELYGPGYELKFRAHCERCVITTIDQETGEKNRAGQPFKTLRDINPAPDNPRSPTFSHYVTLKKGASKVAQVGDQLAKASSA